MCSLLMACVKKETPRPSGYTKDAIAGTWKVEEYAQTVNRSDGTIQISDLTEKVKDSNYTFFFYSDGQGFERALDGKYYRFTNSFNGNKLVLSYSDERSVRFEIKWLMEDSLFMETTETKDSEKIIVSVSFTKVHSGVIALNDLVGSWQVGDALWEISQDGKCKLAGADYTISLDSHRLTLTKSGDSSSSPLTYDVLCFGSNDIRLFAQDASVPVPMTRVNK